MRLVPARSRCRRISMRLVPARGRCRRISMRLVPAGTRCRRILMRLVPARNRCRRILLRARGPGPRPRVSDARACGLLLAPLAAQQEWWRARSLCIDSTHMVGMGANADHNKNESRGLFSRLCKGTARDSDVSCPAGAESFLEPVVQSLAMAYAVAAPSRYRAERRR